MYLSKGMLKVPGTLGKLVIPNRWDEMRRNADP